MKNTDSYLLLTSLPDGLSRNSGLAALRGVVKQSLASVRSLQYRRTPWV